MRQTHDILLADGNDLHHEGVLVVVRVIVGVVRHQLLVVSRAHRHDVLQKVNHLQPVRATPVVKIEAVGLGLDADGVLLHAVFEDELLQEEEGALVLHLLTHLDARRPLIGVGGCSGARVAHVPLDHKLRHEGLLEDGAVQHLLLDREFGLQALTVGFCPDETGVHELHLVQALDALDAEGEELLGLEVRADPVLGGLEVALALLAVEHGALLLDAFGNVHLRIRGSRVG